jgi:hypothetical protein
VLGHLTRVGASQSREFRGPKWASEPASGRALSCLLDRSEGCGRPKRGRVGATFGLCGMTLRATGCSCTCNRQLSLSFPCPRDWYWDRCPSPECARSPSTCLQAGCRGGRVVRCRRVTP